MSIYAKLGGLGLMVLSALLTYRMFAPPTTSTLSPAGGSKTASQGTMGSAPRADTDRLRDELAREQGQVADLAASAAALRAQLASGKQDFLHSLQKKPPPKTNSLLGAVKVPRDAAQPVKFRVFVATYQSDKDLWRCLDTLFKSDLVKHSYEVYVLNNHGTLKLPKRYATRSILVLDNMRRPDWSTGHLARDWNQCLVNGFGSLDTPSAEYVVCMQADNEVAPQFAATLLQLHGEHKQIFVSAGLGDAFSSYTVKAVRRIGLWDERFSNIGWQDYDYFLRAMMWASDAMCFVQKRVGRKPEAEQAFPCPVSDPLLKYQGSGNADRKPSHEKSKAHHAFSLRVFKEKWPFLKKVRGSWGLSVKEMKELGNAKRMAALPDFVTYPYFEAAGEEGAKRSAALGYATPWNGWNPRGPKIDPKTLRIWNCTRVAGKPG